jgi:peptide/nickel transport system substrate-binding protein
MLVGVAAAMLAGSPVHAQETPKTGGTLTASIDFQPKSLDPIFGDSDTADRYVFNQIYESLLRVSAEGKLVPVLATGWTYADDGLSITFKLRPGVVFHDGTPFNAEAVVFNLDRVRNPDTRSNRRQDVISIASVEAIDDLTVKINLAERSAAALPSLAAEGGYMVSPAAVAKYGKDFGRNPVGTGPFRFADWPGDERLNLVRFDGYWGRATDGGKLPCLDAVVVRVIRQASVATLELQAGTVQLANAITVRDAGRLAADSALKILPPRLLTHVMVALNASRPPFDNPLVRRAFAYAFDRNQLATAIGLGQGSVTPIFVAPNEAMYDAGIQSYGYDPVAAKRLLAEAGLGTVAATLSIIQRDPDVQVAQIMQAQALAAGFNLKIEVMDRQAWLDKVAKGKTHDAAMLRASIPKIDADKTFAFYFGRQSATNYSLQQDEKVFSLIERARAETDVAARRGLYSELSRQILDQSYFAFLFNFPSLNVASANLKGLDQDISGAWILDKAWLSQ